MLARKIVITSGKGGVGKTTITANVGCTLSSLGYRVALIDVDFGLNNLDVVLGLENRCVYDLSDVLDGRCRVKQALVQHKERKNLYILSSGDVDSSNAITGQNLKLIIEGLENVFDFIFIDCPAGIDIGFHRAVSCCDEGIVVATPSLVSLKDADKVISIMSSYRLNKVNLVVNRARGDLMLSNKMIYPTDIESILKTKLIGVLPEEDEVFLSLGQMLNSKSLSFKAYSVLAQNILKGSSKIFDVTAKYTGFIGSIKRSLRKNIWETKK